MGYRVLIVEDDPQVAQINSAYLKQCGFELAGIAENAESAIEILHKETVHLILLDIYLPGGNGLDLFRKIRAEEKQIEVIVVSAAKDTVQIREAFRMGCLDYLVKPFTSDRLRDSLEKFQKRVQILEKEFLNQGEIDLLASNQPQAEPSAYLPKGIDRLTLKTVCCALSELEGPFGVHDLADQVEISRVSSKKYLDFLCDQKALIQTYVYGNKGRPASLYQISSAGGGRKMLEYWGRK